MAAACKASCSAVCVTVFSAVTLEVNISSSVVKFREGGLDSDISKVTDLLRFDCFFCFDIFLAFSSAFFLASYSLCFFFSILSCFFFSFSFFFFSSFYRNIA